MQQQQAQQGQQQGQQQQQVQFQHYNNHQFEDETRKPPVVYNGNNIGSSGSSSNDGGNSGSVGVSSGGGGRGRLVDIKVPPPLQVEEFKVEYKEKHGGRAPTTLSVEEAKLQASLCRLDVALESVTTTTSNNTNNKNRNENGGNGSMYDNQTVKTGLSSHHHQKVSRQPIKKAGNIQSNETRTRTAVGITNRAEKI